jgi:16S rRNA processing protein RimM
MTSSSTSSTDPAELTDPTAPTEPTGPTDPVQPAGGSERSAPPSHLEVGFVAKAHGLRGQVVVELVSNRAERMAPGAVLFDPSGRALEIVSASASPSAGRDRWIVGFAGVSDREGADGLRGTTLLGEPITDPDVLWVHDLLGVTVVDQRGTMIGTVVAVEANPASDLLVLDGGGLVPLRFVTARAEGSLTVDIPDGLLDL